jgi:hypothetical protein
MANPFGISGATVSLPQVLTAPVLTGLYEETSNGIPDPLSPMGFMRRDVLVPKDAGTFFRTLGQRKVAKFVARDSSSVERQQGNMEEVNFKCFTTKEHINIPLDSFCNFFDPTQSNLANIVVDEGGWTEIMRQVGLAKTTLMNARIAALAQMLFQGAVYIDGLGSLLPNSTGARQTFSYNVPTYNQNQLNCLNGVNGGGNIIDHGWQDPACPDIQQQLTNIQVAALRLTGRRIRHAIYGRNIPSYLALNVNVSPYMIRNVFPDGGKNDEYLSTGEIPNKLFGINWVPGWSMFYEKDGQNQDLVGGDQICFIPDVADKGWVGFCEGKVAVPQGLVYGDVEKMVKDSKWMAGMYAYAKIVDDPMVVKVIYGDTFFPILRVPQSIFIANVNYGT